jgi:phosphoribosylformylglycinamidine synthase
MICRVVVVKRNGILDPEGQTIKAALNGKGYKFIDDVRVGKIYDIKVPDDEDIKPEIEELSRKILSNSLVEDFKIEYIES